MLKKITNFLARNLIKEQASIKSEQTDIARFTVLLVDSDPDWKKKIQSLFDSASQMYSSLRVKCHQAISLSQALDSLNRYTYDIILTDLNLQDATGFLIAEQLCQYKGKIPVALITNMDNWATIIRSAEVGISDFMSKRELSPDALIRMVMGVTERGNLERCLQSSKLQYQNLTEMLPVGMAQLDENLCITYANEILSNYFNTPLTSICNHPITEIIEPKVEWKLLLTKIKKTESFVECEAVGKNDKSNSKTFLLILNRLCDLNPWNFGYQCIIWDISAQKHKIYQDGLENRLQLITERMSQVYTQLNSNLSAIIVDCANLDTSNYSTDNTQSLKRINHSVVSARSILKPFLSISTNVPIRWETLDINKLLESCFKNAVSSETNEIHYEITLPAEEKYIHLEPAFLQNIFHHLVKNAVESINGKGVISMNARIDRDNKVEKPEYVSFPEASEWLIITISDTGCGFNNNLKSRLIEPLYTTKDESHAGLGLSETWKLIKLLGGWMTLNSKQGTGTNVDLYIPIQSKYLDQERHLMLKPQFDCNKKLTIIIVEDDDDLRKALMDLLTKCNYIVKTFSTAIDALQYFSNNKDVIDYIVSDFYLPFMNGKDFVINIRKISKSVRIIITTGCESDKDFDSFEELSVDSLLYKPYTIANLKKLFLD